MTSRAEDERSVEELIEASSLGTPEAKALRSRTPPEVVERIMQKITERTAAGDVDDAEWLYQQGQQRAKRRAEKVRGMRRD